MFGEESTTTAQELDLGVILHALYAGLKTFLVLFVLTDKIPALSVYLFRYIFCICIYIY